MTLPNEILDSLLSGYLDDALSVDECARVEQLLQSDADARLELESMRELREMLQTIDRTDRPRVSELLRSGFSERVVDAAIECARNEGVAEDHPLLRTTEAPSYRRQHSKRGKRVAAIVFALAASGLIGAILLGPGWTGADPDQVAQQQVLRSEGDNADNANPRIVDASEQSPTLAQNATDNAAGAIANPDIKPASVADAAMAIAENATNAIADSVAPSADAQPNAGVMPKATSIARVENTRDAAVPDAADASLPARLLTVFVIEVRRTADGRFSNPIRAAMKNASIASGDQEPVNEAMVSSVIKSVQSLDVGDSSNANPSPNQVAGSVVYIQAPAKRIQRFINALMADRIGVESVGFNIAMEAPLSNVVRSVESTHATEIRESRAFEFAGELQGASKTLVSHLGKQPFSPWTDDAASLAGGAVKDDGPDIMSRVFVLVR